MDFVKRVDIKHNDLPGRSVQNAVGRNSAVASEKMTVSFCRYNAEYGLMAPHNHAEESVVVLDCDRAFVRWAPPGHAWSIRFILNKGDLMLSGAGVARVSAMTRAGFLMPWSLGTGDQHPA